jgi:aminoglycoside 3-N-acetyltransferase
MKGTAKAQMFLAVRRLFSQRTRSALKKRIVASRKTMKAAYLMMYGQYTASELIGELKSKISNEFDILMVHSTYDRLLPMYTGTPQSLINELINFCGTTRTLVMPTFVLGGRSYDKKEYFSKRAFDVTRVPSEMGLLTEVFRRTPGVMRSLHPTHSICAMGPLAKTLAATHHLASTRTGKGTPFEVMTHERTAIVGLGVEYYRCLAHTHTAEDMLGDEFPVSFQREPIRVGLIDWNGNKIQYDLTIPQASKLVDNTLLRDLLSDEELVEWRFRGTAMFVTFANTVTERLIEAARSGITVYR